MRKCEISKFKAVLVQQRQRPHYVDAAFVAPKQHERVKAHQFRIF